MLDAVVLEIEQRAVVLARKLRLEALDFGLGCFQFLSQRWFALDRRAVDGDLAALGFAPLGDVFAFEPRVDAAAVRELLAQQCGGQRRQQIERFRRRWQSVRMRTVGDDRMRSDDAKLASVGQIEMPLDNSFEGAWL
jgi:hypothetical protein